MKQFNASTRQKKEVFFNQLIMIDQELLELKNSNAIYQKKRVDFVYCLC
jgi:hypothetical protein